MATQSFSPQREVRIMEAVRRAFVEKRPGFDIEAQHLLARIREDLGITSVKTLRIFKRYDFSGVNDAEAKIAKDSILSEPNCDFVYDETLPAMDGLQLFAVESLPGQYAHGSPLSPVQGLAFRGSRVCRCRGLALEQENGSAARARCRSA